MHISRDIPAKPRGCPELLLSWWPWFESHKRHIPFQGTALLQNLHKIYINFLKIHQKTPPTESTESQEFGMIFS